MVHHHQCLCFVRSTYSNCVFFSQDQTKTEKPSALRRTLNALRQRITRRSRAKPPDWFLDKFSNSNNVEKLDKKEGEEGAANSLCNRLSVDTSLPSHYRVSSFLTYEFIKNVLMRKWMIIRLLFMGVISERYDAGRYCFTNILFYWFWC